MNTMLNTLAIARDSVHQGVVAAEWFESAINGKATSMTTFTIELPSEIKVQLGDTAVHTLVPIGSFTSDVVAKAALNGFIGALNNISRGKDDGGKACSDATWAAMREKKVGVWQSGEWSTTARGESSVKLMKDQYISERMVATDQPSSVIEAQIKAAVKKAFGEKESATFGRFLDAVAVGKHPKDVEARASFRKEIEDGLFDRAMKAKAERSKVGDDLDISDLGF